MNLKTQVQSQIDYAQTHKGKAIGSVLGLVAGVSYGLAGKKDNWMVSGLAILGAAAGIVVGGMFDKPAAIVVPVPVDGDDRTPVVSDTSEMDTAGDTAGQDGVMNANGRKGSGKVFANVSGAMADPDTRKCWCSQASTSPDFINVQSLAHCQSLCGGVAGVIYGGNGARRAVRKR